MTHRRLFPLAGIFVSVLLLGLCAAAQGQFTIKQILSAPFPDHLTAAPTGGSVAWVFNAEGVRNLWVAEAPEYKARQLTHYTEDNGFTINDLTWTPDAGAIIFGGDGPNPTSDPEGVTRAIWIVALDGDARRMKAMRLLSGDQAWLPSRSTVGSSQCKVFPARLYTPIKLWSPRLLEKAS